MKFGNPTYLFLVLICLLGMTSQGSAETKIETTSRHLQIAQLNKDDDKEEFVLPELKGIPKNINEIAAKITVRIDSPDGNGSGVIFGRDGNRYFVVTAKHVVQEQHNYQVVTEDERVYEPVEIVELANADLAVLVFDSDKDYQVAAFSDYNLGLNKEAWTFVYGWAKLKANLEPLFTAGKVIGKETGIFLVKDDLSLSKTSGYELIYTNLSERGMSGGPVLDASGRVIGIHTSAEGERYRLTDKLQLGFSLGIPIATFLESSELKTIAKENFLELQTTKERADVIPFAQPSLSREELDSVGSHLLFVAPDDGANETEWVNHGNQLWRTSRYGAAIKAFNKAIDRKTNFHQAYYGKGLALYDLGKYPEANRAFEQAIALNSNFYPALYRQSLTLLTLKQYATALEIIDRAIALKPENTALSVLRGRALQNLARYDEAIVAYNKAIAVDNNPLILTRRGSIYRILGKQDLALADFQQAIKADPQYAEGYINRALTYYQLEDYRQALINLNHVVGSITNDDARAYLARGYVYQKLGNVTQAQVDFARAFNLYDRNRQVQAEGTQVSLQTDEYRQVNTDFQQILELDPQATNLLLGRGIAYLLLDEKQQAMDSLTKAKAEFESQQDRFGQNLAQKIIIQAQQPIRANHNVDEANE